MNSYPSVCHLLPSSAVTTSLRELDLRCECLECVRPRTRSSTRSSTQTFPSRVEDPKRNATTTSSQSHCLRRPKLVQEDRTDRHLRHVTATGEQLLQRRPVVRRDARRGDGDGVLRAATADRGAGAGAGPRRWHVPPPAARVAFERNHGLAQVLASSPAPEALLGAATSAVHVPPCWHRLTEIYLRFLRDKELYRDHPSTLNLAALTKQNGVHHRPRPSRAGSRAPLTGASQRQGLAKEAFARSAPGATGEVMLPARGVPLFLPLAGGRSAQKARASGEHPGPRRRLLRDRYAGGGPLVLAISSATKMAAPRRRASFPRVQIQPRRERGFSSCTR